MSYINVRQICMLYFDWDPKKSASNLEKHKISFELAKEVFSDPKMLTKFDRNIDGEDRFHGIGCIDGEVIINLDPNFKDGENLNLYLFKQGEIFDNLVEINGDVLTIDSRNLPD